MANEWYVQHSGKHYGPMSSAQLKKLAAEGKVTPAMQVRSGSQGAWVSASRVQGLFGSVATAAKARAKADPEPTPARKPSAQETAVQKPVVQPTSPRAAPPKAQPLAAVPTAQSAPPPVSSGLAPPPWARPAAAQTAVPSEGMAMGAKILGAVGIIFGAVALATCWLPILGGPLGWTGIVVGGLGLVIGIGGLVVAAMSRGAGLILNVAGTSSSAVGLVLAVVLGVTFGLFQGAPAPRIVQRPALPPVVVPPAKPAPVQAEPEPPPEPVWTDAAEPITQGPITATIAGVGIEPVRLESTDLSTLRRQKAQPMLKIRVTLENTSSDKIVEAPGWVGGGDLIGQGVGRLLSQELGQAVQSATATAKLADSGGNIYKQTPAMSVFGAQVNFGADAALRPGKTTQAELIFQPPLESIEYLRLELPPAGFSGMDSLRFQIPRAMITGMPAPAGG